MSYLTDDIIDNSNYRDKLINIITNQYIGNGLYTIDILLDMSVTQLEQVVNSSPNDQAINEGVGISWE